MQVLGAISKQYFQNLALYQWAITLARMPFLPNSLHHKKYVKLFSRVNHHHDLNAKKMWENRQYNQKAENTLGIVYKETWMSIKYSTYPYYPQQDFTIWCLLTCFSLFSASSRDFFRVFISLVMPWIIFLDLSLSSLASFSVLSNSDFSVKNFFSAFSFIFSSLSLHLFRSSMVLICSKVLI